MVLEEKKGLGYCPLCGFENDDDVEFCVKCGTPLDSSQPRMDSDKNFGSNKRDKKLEYSNLTPLTFLTGIIIGGILILLGIGMALFFHNTYVQRYYGSPLLITLGLFIFAVSIYKKIRQKN